MKLKLVIKQKVMAMLLNGPLCCMQDNMVGADYTMVTYVDVEVVVVVVLKD